MTPDLDLGDTRAIIAEAERAGLLRNQLAYALGTSYHESAHTMKPVREMLETSDDEAIERLERAWAKGQLRHVKTPYWRKDREGKSWLGRGYVQLTHRSNYERAGRELGLDLTTDPSVVMRPDVACQILVRGMAGGWFTGKRLSDFITLRRSDFVGARRIINGTDRAADIAAIAKAYDKALLAEGYGVTPAPEPVPPVPEPDPLERALADLRDARAETAAAKTRAAQLQAENEHLRDIIEDAASVLALGVKP